MHAGRLISIFVIMVFLVAGLVFFEGGCESGGNNPPGPTEDSAKPKYADAKAKRHDKENTRRKELGLPSLEEELSKRPQPKPSAAGSRRR